MTDAEVLAICSRVLGDLIADDSITLTMDTRRRDVPEWDSFSYINFIAAIENELCVKFGVADIESFAVVGDIVRRIQAMTRGTSR